jgi:chloride channel protein, CIC family
LAGGVADLAAIAYNRALLETLAEAERLGRLSVELRAGLIGATVGTLAKFAPNVVGSGEAITQRSLAGAETLSVLPLVFYSASGSARYHMPPEHQAGSSHPMLAWPAARLVPWASLQVGIP